MTMTKNVLSFNYNDGDCKRAEEEIIIDETIKLNINKALTRDFLISLNSLEDFCVGYMLGEGLINDIKNIEEITIENNTINAFVNLDDFDIRKELVVRSDCF